MHICITFCSQSPAASPFALTVGGTRQGDNLYHIGNEGTNYGSCVDIFAPGQNISSAGFSSRTAVATFHGTSQATPLVSGAAAIYWNNNRGAELQQLKHSVIYSGTVNRINFNEFNSPELRRQTPNCFLFID